MKFPGGLVTSDHPVKRLHIEEGPRLRDFHIISLFCCMYESLPSLFLSPETRLSYAAGPVDE